jgi:hypothetical protein
MIYPTNDILVYETTNVVATEDWAAIRPCSGVEEVYSPKLRPSTIGSSVGYHRRVVLDSMLSPFHIIK